MQLSLPLSFSRIRIRMVSYVVAVRSNKEEWKEEWNIKKGNQSATNFMFITPLAKSKNNNNNIGRKTHCNACVCKQTTFRKIARPRRHTCMHVYMNACISIKYSLKRFKCLPTYLRLSRGHNCSHIVEDSCYYCLCCCYSSSYRHVAVIKVAAIICMASIKKKKNKQKKKKKNSDV